MARPFKFRYVNEIVGTFVLLTLGMLMAGILSAGFLQGWLDERRDFVILLPQDVPTGLRKGSEVQIYSTTVGAVRSMRVSTEGEMTAEIRIRGDLIHFVRQDSRAVIRKKFGVAGDSYIEITRGTGEARPVGDRLEASLDEDVTSRMLGTLRDVGDAAKYTMFQVNQLLAEYTSLARSLEQPIAELGLALNEAREIAEGLHRGEGAVGKLLTDDALYQESTLLLTDLRRTLERVDQVLLSTHATTEELPKLSHEAADVLVQARSTLAELERLLQGLQNHWVLRKYVPGMDAAPDMLLIPGALTEERP